MPFAAGLIDGEVNIQNGKLGQKDKTKKDKKNRLSLKVIWRRFLSAPLL